MAYTGTHNLSKHRLFTVWIGIVRRCYSESSNTYKNYGAKGVKVCDLWRNNFKEFYDWALANGWQKGMQIDKDIKAKKLGVPALLYSPEMCSIVTPKENSNNKSTNRLIEYMGEIKTATQWAESLGVPKDTFMSRLYKYKDICKAMTMPHIPRESIKKPVECISTNERFASVGEAARIKKISEACISRVLKGKRAHTRGLIFKYLN